MKIEKETQGVGGLPHHHHFPFEDYYNEKEAVRDDSLN